MSGLSMRAWVLLVLVGPIADSSEPNSRRPPVLSAMVATPDGRGFLVGSQAGIAQHPTNTTSSEPFPTTLDHVHALAFDAEGTTLAVGGGSPAESGLVELRRWPEGDLLAQLNGHDDVIHDVAWIDRTILATAGADRLVKIWNIVDGIEVATLEGHSGPVRALAVAPGQGLLCSASVDGTIRVWDLDSWTLLRTLTNHLGPVHALAFRPDVDEAPLAVLASASEDQTVRIWQPEIGRLVRIIRHPTPVLQLGWSKASKGPVSASKDGVVRWLSGIRAEILEENVLSDEHWLTCLDWLSASGSWVVGDSSGTLWIVEDPHAP